MNSDPGHPELREWLGSYALGHLDPADEALVRRHLDGCAECRAELAALAPLGPRLAAIDPAALADAPVSGPAADLPPELGEGIRAAILAGPAAPTPVPAASGGPDGPDGPDELAARRAASRRTRPSRVQTGVAAALVVVALGAGAAIGRGTAPEPAAVPTEPIELVADDGSGVHVTSAGLVNHTWGTELRMVAEGFAEGERFKAAFRLTSGRLVPAGEFRGTGDASMTCNLQSSVLRDQVVEVVVTDAAGETLLTSPL